MKILYGVQATGNGHITRARVMAPALVNAGVEVDYLFSGRAPEQLFDMNDFGACRYRKGLTFYMDNGRINYWKSLTGNNLIQLGKDIKSLSLAAYDLVVTDFEPITAWAAKFRGVPSVGIAHQYAFLYSLPNTKSSFFLKNMVRSFAPAQKYIGLHWQHFAAAICPPLIQPPLFSPLKGTNKIVVYLPYDRLDRIKDILLGFPQYDFYVYRAITHKIVHANVHLCPFSRAGFQQDIADSDGVICNSGFGLLSEAMQYGKKILTIPQKGQIEQESNAEILHILKLGLVAERLESAVIAQWLTQPEPEAIVFPDVASALATWIAGGCVTPIEDSVSSLWDL